MDSGLIFGILFGIAISFIFIKAKAFLKKEKPSQTKPSSIGGGSVGSPIDDDGIVGKGRPKLENF